MFIIVIAGVAGVVGVLIVIAEKKITKVYRENCCDVISIGIAVINLAVAVDKGLSKAESCCFIVISSGSICWNQSVCERL